ncbi:MAG: hypothetical protein LBJ00_05040 [Planctomycetaceae bacterium]|jgi:hypothetical protein|nr:hypothetical protein [Planctomycetaceae bacterium]
MIEFICPDCKKFYSVSERFVGRRMVCANCKANLTVPDFSTAINPETAQLQPQPPKSQTIALKSDVTVAVNDAETALLAAVFTDKMQDKRDAAERAKIPPKLPTKKDEIVPKRKIISNELMIIGLMILISICAAVYFVFFFDWLGADARVDLLGQIEERRIKTTIAIGGKDSEVAALRVRSTEAWGAACDAIDAFVTTIGDIDTKNRDVLELDWNIALNAISESGKRRLIVARDEVKESLPAIESNLSKLKLQSAEFVAKAERTEQATDAAILDAVRLREELKFYDSEVVKLKQKIADLPDERPVVTFPVFDQDSPNQKRESIVRIDSDWTEEYYDQFSFEAARRDNYFTSFDGIRRLFGDRSLRVTLFERMPIAINFPKDGGVLGNELEVSRTLRFAVRFPALTDAIMVGEERETGQFSEMSIKFSNNAGYVEFKTKSREYCDAVFYSGRGKFVVIEFSLEGDEFWARSDNFDKNKLTKILESKEKRDLTEEEIKALVNEAKASEREREAAMLSFFVQVDRVKFRLVPVSSRTTFWLDGIAISGESKQSKIDLVKAKSTKRDLQNLEKEIREKRRQRSVIYSLSKIKGFQDWQPEQQNSPSEGGE